MHLISVLACFFDFVLEQLWKASQQKEGMDLHGYGVETQVEKNRHLEPSAGLVSQWTWVCLLAHFSLFLKTCFL